MKTEKKPDWVLDHSLDREIFLDLRRFLRHGLEPLPEIEGLLKEMRPCQVLRLASTREPTLIYRVLKDKGFEHYAEHKDGSWDIYFRNCAWNGNKGGRS